MCGSPAPSSCSRCHSRRYCSKLHQLYDWKQGKHKTLCVPRGADAVAASSTDAAAAPAPAADAATAPVATLSSLLFPQKEVVIEPEDLSDSEAESDDEGEGAGDDKQSKQAGSSGSGGAGKASSKVGGQGKGKKSKGDFSKEHRLLEAYEKEKAESKDGAEEEEEDAREVEATAANWNAPGKLKDPLFTKFKCRVEQAPDQVLRYDRAPGETVPAGLFQPLWVSTWYQPGSPPMPPVAPQKPGQKPSPPPRPVAPTSQANDAAVPPCARCGCARRFEFQVLPQLLYYLGPLGSGLDFATVAVYTCGASCGDGIKDGYVEEFCWVQAHAQ